MEKNIYVFPFDDALDRPNIVYIKGDKESLLIDAGGGPKTYKYIMDEIKKNNLDYPTYVLLTHYHWDHMFGIGYFSSIGICSKYTNEMIEKHMKVNAKEINELIDDSLQPEFCLEHLLLEYDDLTSLKLRKCEMEVSDYTLDLGNRIINIYEVPSSHTEGSLIVFDNNSETLFIGDADYGYIVGKEFYDDAIKRNAFIECIRKIPCKYILLGHSYMRTKEEFLSEIE